MSSLLAILKQLAFPPRCAGCHRFLRVCEKGSEHTFCESCKDAWEREMRRQCSSCYAAYCECHCQPSIMKRAGCESFIKLAPYGEGDAYRVVRRMVLDMKRKPRKEVLVYLAEELSVSVAEALHAMDITVSDALISYLPRLPRRIRREGVDQAKELAQALSSATGIPCRRLLARRGKGSEQKKLNAKARSKNLREELLPCGDPTGLFVILVDDIVTTGASMSVAAKLLKHRGATGVMAVAVAHTEKKMRRFF